MFSKEQLSLHSKKYMLKFIISACCCGVFTAVLWARSPEDVELSGSSLSKDTVHSKAVQKQRVGMLYLLSQTGLFKTLCSYSRMTGDVKSPGCGHSGFRDGVRCKQHDQPCGLSFSPHRHASHTGALGDAKCFRQLPFHFFRAQADPHSVPW